METSNVYDAYRNARVLLKELWFQLMQKQMPTETFLKTVGSFIEDTKELPRTIDDMKLWSRMYKNKEVEIAQRDARIKALEEEVAFEIKVANAQTEIAKELAQEKEALEERLEAAENVIDKLPNDYGEWDQADDSLMSAMVEREEEEFNEALEAYNKLKH